MIGPQWGTILVLPKIVFGYATTSYEVCDRNRTCRRRKKKIYALLSYMGKHWINRLINVVFKKIHTRIVFSKPTFVLFDNSHVFLWNNTTYVPFTVSWINCVQGKSCPQHRYSRLVAFDIFESRLYYFMTRSVQRWK